MIRYTSVALSALTVAVVAAVGCTPPEAPAATATPAAPAEATPSASPAAPAGEASGAAVAGDSGVAPAPATADSLAQAAAAVEAPPTGVRSLSGTRWVEAAEGGQFRELVFTDAFVFFRLQDETTVTLPVDYTSTHPACLGYPSCLLTIDGNQQAVPFFLGMQEDVIFFVDCTYEGAPGPEGTPVTVAALAEQLGTAVVHQSPTTICWNPGRVPFRQAPR